MNGLLEAATRFYQPYFDAWFRAVGQGLQTQQEILRAWAGGVSGLAGRPACWAGPLPMAVRQWAQDMADLTRKFQEHWETQYKSGMRVLDDLFRMPESHDPHQLQRRVVEFYRKAYEHWRDLGQAQVRELRDGAGKWPEGLRQAS